MQLRRSDHSPRMELTPLIDVIFLLLTFFIYNLIVSVQAQVLNIMKDLQRQRPDLRRGGFSDLSRPSAVVDRLGEPFRDPVVGIGLRRRNGLARREDLPPFGLAPADGDEPPERRHDQNFPVHE